MSKKIALLILIGLIILAGALLFFYRDKITTQQPPVTQGDQQNVKENQPPVFSFLDEKDYIDLEGTESYKIGSVEFRVHGSADIIKSPGYFEVYQNGSKMFANDPNYRISGLLAFKFGDNTYVVVKDYSGGAHCCDTDYIFRVNKSSEVKLIKTFDMGNTTIAKGNLLFKNGKLYFVLTDDSFSYFHVGYANSYFFQQYYQLEGDTVTVANKDFAAELTKVAEGCKAKIPTSPAQPDENGNYWLNNVICYVANYTLVGKQDIALKDFNGFFSKFFPSGTGKDAFGETITRDALKQEIVDTLKNDRFN